MGARWVAICRGQRRAALETRLDSSGEVGRRSFRGSAARSRGSSRGLCRGRPEASRLRIAPFRVHSARRFHAAGERQAKILNDANQAGTDAMLTRSSISRQYLKPYLRHQRAVNMQKQALPAFRSNLCIMSRVNINLCHWIISSMLECL